MRPFRSWSEPAIEVAAVTTGQRVLDLMMVFRDARPVPPDRAEVEAYCRELHDLIEALSREERRITHLADELGLREHWRDLGTARR
jgi:hypothetical protein